MDRRSISISWRGLAAAFLPWRRIARSTASGLNPSSQSAEAGHTISCLSCSVCCASSTFRSLSLAMILLENGNRILGETVAAQLKAPSVPHCTSSSSSTSSSRREQQENSSNHSSNATRTDRMRSNSSTRRRGEHSAAAEHATQ